MTLAQTGPVLVVAAHPDDEVLGCGGTIARLVREGHEVHICILGEGATSRQSDGEPAHQGQVETPQSQCREVASYLGAREPSFFGLPDNRFDTVPLLEVVRLVEGLVQSVAPRTVFTHHLGDLNIDHVISHRAVLTATRPMADCPVKEVYSFEVPSATEWAFSPAASAFQPTMFMDISETLDAKIGAMSKYRDELREFPHPRSPEALEAIARRWGSTVGVKAAEAFQVVRAVR